MNHPVPPHYSARHEHRRGRESRNGPRQLRRRMAEAGAAAWNPDAVDAAEMQVGEPIDHLVHSPCPNVGVSYRLNPVGQTLEQIRAAEVGPAYRKQQDDSKAPETDHA